MATSQRQVARLVSLADITPDDVVCDLGFGDAALLCGLVKAAGRHTLIRLAIHSKLICLAFHHLPSSLFIPECETILCTMRFDWLTNSSLCAISLKIMRTSMSPQQSPAHSLTHSLCAIHLKLMRASGSPHTIMHRPTTITGSLTHSARPHSLAQDVVE